MKFRFPVISTGSPTYHETIVVENAGLRSLLTTELNTDILPALQAMTGKTFSVVASSPLQGVVKVSVDGTLTGQQYTIRSNGKNSLYILGGNWRACRHGLYAWLAELGCKQMMPGSRWRITPSLTDLRRTFNITKSPAIKSAGWGPQGADSLSGPFPYSTADITAWYDFMRWNGWVQAHYTSAAQPFMSFGPHMDPFCYLDNAAALDADPLHFAQKAYDWKPSTRYTAGEQVTANGKRYTCTAADGYSAGSGTGPSGTGTGIVDGTVTWDYVSAVVRVSGLGSFHNTHEGNATGTNYSGSAGVVGIYGDWINVKLNTEISNAANMADLQMTQSGAAGDGYEWCHCTKCRDLLRNEYGINKDASPSDLQLWRNGKIWQKVKALRPGLDFVISDYAYDWQAPVPTPGWAINPNLFVNVAAFFYAVDNTPPYLRLDKWTARKNLDGFKLGAYEYWSLPFWTKGDARFSTNEAWKHLRTHIANGFQAMVSENTYSAGSVGLHWWGAQQLIWGSTKTDAQLIDEFCTTAFGAAATHMQRLFTRWWGDEKRPWFPGNGYEFALSFEDMRQAIAAVSGDAGALSRVTAYACFLLGLHYLQVWRDTEASPPSQATTETRYDEIMQFLYSVWHTYMVDVRHIREQVYGSALPSAGWKSGWYVPTGAGPIATWKTDKGISDWTDAQIRARFETVRTASYSTVPTPATYTAPNYTALTRPNTPGSSVLLYENALNAGETPDSGQEWIVEVRAGTTDVLRFRYQQPYALQPEGLSRVRVYDLNGTLLNTYEHAVPKHDFISYDIALNTFTPGFYRVVLEASCFAQFWAQRSTPVIRFGRPLRATWGGDGLPGWFPTRFFVPKGVTAFHIYDLNTVGDRVFYDSTDTLRSTTAIYPNVYRINVPAGQDQKIWRYEGRGQPPWFLDIPDFTAPTPGQMIVPTNLWTE